MAAQEPFLSRRYPWQDLFFSLFLLKIRILPWFIFRPVTHAALWVFFWASPRLRRNARESLDIAFGNTLTVSRKKELSYRSFFNLAEGIAAFIYAIEHPRITSKYFIWEGKEHLDRVLQRGKGAVIAIAHFGPFVWMIQHFANEGYKVNVVMRPPRSDFFKEKFPIAREKLGMNLIFSVPVKKCVVESFRALERDELVFMPIDQNYGGNGRVFVDFFGRKAATAPGVIGYGLKTGAPVLLAVCLPMPDGRFKIVIEPELDLSGQKDERAVLVQYTSLLTSRLEALIRDYPEQWSWMHRRWKAVPKDGEL